MEQLLSALEFDLLSALQEEPSWCTPIQIEVQSGRIGENIFDVLESLCSKKLLRRKGKEVEGEGLPLATEGFTYHLTNEARRVLEATSVCRQYVGIVFSSAPSESQAPS